MLLCLINQMFVLQLLALVRTASTPCGPNPGEQLVTRDDGTTYPYFGMPCTKADGAPDSACGACFLDRSCTCEKKCCVARSGPPGYACLSKGVDTVGTVCIAGDVGRNKTLAQLADACDAMHHAAAGSGIGCAGFNTNGYLKKCFRSSCGAMPSVVAGQPKLQSCFRADTPYAQPIPQGSAPTCHHGPAPTPPGPPFVPPYGGGCVGTWNQTSCNCSGAHPPFGAPQHEVQLQEDYHFPSEEAAERAALMHPELVSVSTASSSAVLRNPTVNESATLVVEGTPKWGWELLHVGADGSAVLEHDFGQWSEMVFIFVSASRRSVSVRKPVGRLADISQPLYTMETTIDPQYYCKQDIDPTDWMGRLASNISGGEEPSLLAANTLMAPNTDSGIFGNPEDHSKFLLTHRSVLSSTGDFSHHGSSPRTLWALAHSAYLPAGCENVTDWEQVKMGMAGNYLRVINQGMWHPAIGCGVEIMALSPPPVVGADGNFGTGTVTALLRVTAQVGETTNTSYVRAQLTDDGAGPLQLDDFGSNGTEFYAALLAQEVRWGAFVERGAKAHVPQVDRRYTASSNALMTMYMNTDRGLIPQYGAGKFWNTYNTLLPLDSLALNGALLEWGHTTEALNYLRYFFSNFVCMEDVCKEPYVRQYHRLNGIGNASYGGIEYNIFGCDSDADYGRLIDMYVQAVRYSGNLTWAAEMLPIAQALAQNVLVRRDNATADYPKGHPFHGIVYSSPEHDICSAPSYFFSPNVWFVRGLLSLAHLHMEYPALTANATLEARLLPEATAWREDIRFAANFTAVRNGDGSVFFVHPVVGSAYSEANPPLSPHVTPREELVPNAGGDIATCVARGTCFVSMSAGVPGIPGGGSNQHTDYTNFRIFSETLLAGILDPEYELGIMSFRESHRGTLLGMTRFRDLLDDMPILGYGYGSLAHDRLYSFHNTLAGHSMNYISRGTYWGAEQREQLDYKRGNRTGIVNHRWRNDCEDKGEDCSLCMVSGIASAFWVRWMLVSESPDTEVVFVARGAPRRWYAQTAEPFGISQAPTRFGKLTYTMQAQLGGTVEGSVQLEARPGVAIKLPLLVTVKIRSADAGTPLLGKVTVHGEGAALVAWHANNESAVVRLGPSLGFNFTAK